MSDRDPDDDHGRFDDDLEARRAYRRRFREAKEESLDLFLERLDRLDADDLEDEAQAELHDRVEEVRQTNEDLREKLLDLYEADDAEWEALREKFDDSWNEFEAGWNDLTHYVEERLDHSEDDD